MLLKVTSISVTGMFLTSAIISKSVTFFSSARDSVTVTNNVDKLALDLTVLGISGFDNKLQESVYEGLDGVVYG